LPLYCCKIQTTKLQTHGYGKGGVGDKLDSNSHHTGSVVMSDQDDWDFAGADDAKAEIRAAVAYLLKGATGTARDLIALEVMEILRQVANGLAPGQQDDPFDDELPGGQPADNHLAVQQAIVCRHIALGQVFSDHFSAYKKLKFVKASCKEPCNTVSNFSIKGSFGQYNRMNWTYVNFSILNEIANKLCHRSG
jgi:hypothetical protein